MAYQGDLQEFYEYILKHGSIARFLLFLFSPHLTKGIVLNNSSLWIRTDPTSQLASRLSYQYAFLGVLGTLDDRRLK